MGNIIVKLPEVLSITKKSRSAVFADIKRGTFPSPIRLGVRSVGWTIESIDRWIAERVAESKGAL